MGCMALYNVVRLFVYHGNSMTHVVFQNGERHLFQKEHVNVKRPAYPIYGLGRPALSFADQAEREREWKREDPDGPMTKIKILFLDKRPEDQRTTKAL